MNFQCNHCLNIYSASEEDMGYEVECPHCHQAVTVPSSLFERGVVFGEFILKHKIATWEKGKVFAAYQTSLQRDVGLKMLIDVKDRQDVLDFIEEARKDAQLGYPHRGQIFMLGEHNGVFYCAIENIETEHTNTTIFMKEIVITAPPPHKVDVTTQDDVTRNRDMLQLTPREKSSRQQYTDNRMISEPENQNIVYSQVDENLQTPAPQQTVEVEEPQPQMSAQGTGNTRAATVVTPQSKGPKRPPIKVAAKDNRKTRIAFKTNAKVKKFKK